MLPADYEPVDFRIHRFYDRHPEGRILTELHSIHRNSDGSARQYVFKAEVFRDIKSPIPDATGFAEETVGISTGPRASLLETCETSAIGRALANLGFSPKGFRPSAEEMQKASRHSHPSAAHVDENAVPAEKTYGVLDGKPDPFDDRPTRQPTNQSPVRGLATEKQINFAKSLARKKGYEAEISGEMTVVEMAKFIDHLKSLEDIK
jgi:hypothetical protein